VRDLRANDVIHITTVTDPHHLGYRAIALVAVSADGTRRHRELAAEMAEIEAVDWAAVTLGAYELFVNVIARDTEALQQILENDIAGMPGVASIEALPYLRLHYQEPRWEIARWKAGDRGLRPVVEFDEVDRLILGELSADGRASFEGIAREVGVSEWQVRQRVGRLLELEAVRIMAIANPRSLGFQTNALIGVVATTGSSLEELADHLAGLPSISYVAICAGRFDIFLEAICVDEEDLLRVLDTEVRTAPGVARVETFLYLDLQYKRIRPLAPRRPQK
jgi:DNA-binding Lrp family transcriptional regulator